MREDRQLYTIIEIIKNYSGKEPLNRYLKNHFNAHREMGSRDRRQAADSIYNYYRIGKAIAGRPIEERIAVGNYLCADSFSPVMQYCIAKFLEAIATDSQVGVVEKIHNVQSLYTDFKTSDIFPCTENLSGQVDADAFTLSMLRQPKVWIRVRRKYIKEVTDELTKENISFQASEESELTLAFASSTKLDKLKSYEKGYFEIQDWSSQQTVNYFKPEPKQHWWDACAGSGGKSLLLLDAEPEVRLTVSDSRESILNNLKERFRKAGIRSYETVPADLAERSSETLKSKLFDGIIADVPCTGSGTWARTPEWLTTFGKESINNFVNLQRSIVSNIIPNLKKDHPLIYITCSALKEENEGQVEWMERECKLKAVESAYLKGYERGGDTMFVARMVKR